MANTTIQSPDFPRSASHRSRLRWTFLALALPLGVGCPAPEDPDAGAVDAGVDAGPFDAGPTPQSQVIFDPAVLDGPTAATFFDLPYPSDLRTDADGHPDLTGFPGARGLVAQAIATVQQERAGFSPITGVYFRFTEALSEPSLPADPAASRMTSSQVLLIDIDPDSAERGALVPSYVRFQHEATAIWPANTLVVRPVPGFPLHPGRRYAAVVRAGIRSLDGDTVLPASAFEALKTTGATGPLAEHYGALFDDLDALGIPRGEILNAAAFRISDSAAEMDLARAYVDAQPVPTLSDWSVSSVTPQVTNYIAAFETYELMDASDSIEIFGGGRIAFDPSGQPLAVRRARVRVGISVPSGDPPAEGYPIVLYGHGTGGSFDTHFGEEGRALARQGVAVLGFEAALHGARSDVEPESLIASNAVGAREMVRQTVIDMMVLYRMIAAGAVVVPTGLAESAPITFQADPVLYMGHSQGAQEGGLLLGVEPSIQAAFLSEGGGGGIITVVERELTTGGRIACLVAALISESCAAFGEDHPALTLVVQPLLDPADPLSFAHRFLRERPTDWADLSIAMTEGETDPYTPPRTIEALAGSIGLPLVEPVVLTSEAYTLRDSPRVTAPVTGNLTLPSGAMITGGLMQWPDVGHFAIYDIPDATNRYVQFFVTAVAADGTPTIVAPL